MDHAAWILVAELLNRGAVLSRLFRRVTADLPEETLKGQEPEAVALEMMVGSAFPALRKAGPEECRQAAELICQVHDRVMSDLRLAMEIAERRG